MKNLPTRYAELRAHTAEAERRAREAERLSQRDTVLALERDKAAAEKYGAEAARLAGRLAAQLWLWNERALVAVSLLGKDGDR